MEYDEDKVDDLTLALMHLVTFDESEAGARAWKGFDWDSLGRLHEKGLIGDPVGEAKSVVLTPEGVRRSKALFDQHFGQRPTPAT